MTKAVTVAILVSLAVLFAAPAAAFAQLPALPHYFYGTVKINGADAPAGTTVEARVAGVMTGAFNPVVTTQPGKYGDPNPSVSAPRLLVQGNIAGGATIEFFINGVKAGQTAVWQSGQISVLDLTVIVAVPPVANFTRTLSPATGLAPCAVTFIDASTGPPTSWSWSFGDGTGSSSQNPVKTYAAPGNYTITLSVNSALGSSSTSQMVNIYAIPAAGFTDTASGGVAPLTINFTDSSRGNIVNWLWNFGDGATSTTRNPTRTYSAAGNYTVTLTVTNPVGSSSATAIKSVYSTPSAWFTASATSAEPGAVIHFSDQSSGNITDWSWSFGDGTGSSSQNPSRSYTSTGNHTVALTTSNPAGSNTLTRPGYITITSAPLNLQAETGLLPDVNAAGYAVLRARINSLKIAASGETHAVSDGIGSFTAFVTYDPIGLTVMGVEGVDPFGAPAVTMATGRTDFSASQSGAAPAPPLAVTGLRVRLAGARAAAYTVTLNFNNITRVTGDGVAQSGPATVILRRGDARADGVVNMVDALYIAQYRVGIRDTTTMNAVNAASVYQDDATGDKVTMTDAMFIAHAAVGLRDAMYNPV
ncbi:MAG: PKD domain-containing protein [Chloroflexi bacterium]|nr:PKD domain-containing protein [Chloroflexota bacterium]